jgi:hypothetical protein
LGTFPYRGVGVQDKFGRDIELMSPLSALFQNKRYGLRTLEANDPFLSAAS